MAHGATLDRVGDHHGAVGSIVKRVDDMTLYEYWTSGPGSVPLNRVRVKNVKGLEIEFTDGEKRVIEGNLRTHVKDNVLHVELKHESFGFAAWYEDRGSYPIVNVKSYHWIE